MPPQTLALSSSTGISISLHGRGYNLPKYKGHGHAIRVTHSSSNPLLFEVDGDLSTGAYLRVSHHTDLSLEINHRKNKDGNNLSTWYCNGHREWGCKFVMNSDLTLRPQNDLDLCVGRSSSGSVILVKRSSGTRIVFDATGNAAVEGMARERKEREDKEREERDMMPAIAESLLTWDAMASFVGNGYMKLEQVISQDLVDAAVKEINHELGVAQGSTDQFKAKTFASEDAITDLFNRSVLPYVMARLLGDDYGRMKYRQGAGQLALRFPGDACVGKTAQSNEAHFKNIASHWHIDGCANGFIKGVTDHYGEVRNFDVLVGVCLSETKSENSGELVCWPGSHDRLSAWLAVDDNMKKLKEKGNVHLPTGEGTPSVFEGLAPVSCLAKPGDVYVANYMVAHAIAPNASPHIRYAVYFRVKGPGFRVGGREVGGCEVSMLQPWVHWNQDVFNGESKVGEGGGGGGKGATPLTGKASGGEEEWESYDEALMKEEGKLENDDFHHLTADNVHLTPKVEGWACVCCTFLHAGDKAGMELCEMCEAPRPR